MTESTASIRLEIRTLLSTRQSVELATVSADGIPCASYAPFVSGDPLRLYVFLSDLAPHTGNINQNPKVSAMIIEDEHNSPNLFARHRLILDCVAVKIARDDQDFSDWIAKYQERFGAIVDTLVQLADFNLYCLAPKQGTFVKGFGQAYRISGNAMDRIEHITNPAREMNQANNKGT